MTEAQLKVDRFLDLYKELEEALRERGMTHGRSSIIMQFISSPEGRPFKDELNTCREMRNILAHNQDIDGEAPFVPTDASIKALEKILAYMKMPPLALSKGTRYENLICAKLSDRAKPIMEKMVSRGYSHIPVFENGVLFGVFSISTIFSHILEHGEAVIDEDTLISDFNEDLPIENHIAESFEFASAETTVLEAEALLKNASGPESKRIAALFITRNGNKNERILGMVTPWDVLQE